jgi:hypothetical protein
MTNVSLHQLVINCQRLRHLALVQYPYLDDEITKPLVEQRNGSVTWYPLWNNAEKAKYTKPPPQPE